MLGVWHRVIGPSRNQQIKKTKIPARIKNHPKLQPYIIKDPSQIIATVETKLKNKRYKLTIPERNIKNNISHTNIESEKCRGIAFYTAKHLEVNIVSFNTTFEETYGQSLNQAYKKNY